ncbi:thiopurine S-methyltransferase [Massilia antarctica]|uniref:thiopurine S-methyltransferase n=1 Tax=Massilia antarctica TaxID=2765360 RepID=UPI0006BB6337|nr:thiopurine S-methyltransferase [Massilia sp. H27-R4]MCY0910117.1 thiopurine S-methyltransferase [Massilia sp. H27-R4]CUI02793.1 Thiopurine S-methyltransferase [Janthinobacterium sp. CG23_2]CUU26579.1 Thiopurine S-methyltransferase [Janthinobacterium sp. CG23_2]
MDRNFWHRKWASNEIGFHERAANPLMLAHAGRLGLAAGSRVFVPLCGKSLDLHWLLSEGYRVAGAELSRIAVDQLFADLGLTPEVRQAGELLHYRAPDIDIFVGDIFCLDSELLGRVDAVYDRAAFVALPESMRTPYAAHVTQLAGRAPQLLICYQYDQALMNGPPFSIGDDEVRQCYGHAYALTLLARTEVAGGFKGRFPAVEAVWLLQ